MRKWVGLFIGANLFAGICFCRAPNEADNGRQAEQRSCTPCHSLRLIDSQRLSAAAWQKEVDKMIGWGAIVPDRKQMIDYLAEHYSNTRPPETPAHSADRK